MKITLNYFLILLRIVLALFFIFSGYAKLYPVEQLEIKMVETGITGWSIAPVLARLLIAFEFFLGLLLLLNLFSRKTMMTTMLTLLLFSGYLTYTLLFNPAENDCGCFGFLFPMTPFHSLLKNMLLLLFAFILFRHQPTTTFRFLQNRQKQTLVLLLGLSLAYPFIKNPLEYTPPPATGQANKISLNEHVFYTKNKTNRISMNEGKKIICFFSTHCKFCKLAAKKIKIAGKNNPQIASKIYFLFFGEEKTYEDIKNFQYETQTESFPVSALHPIKFFELSGASLPAIFFVNNDSVVMKRNFLSLTEKDIVGFLTEKTP